MQVYRESPRKVSILISYHFHELAFSWYLNRPPAVVSFLASPDFRPLRSFFAHLPGLENKGRSACLSTSMKVKISLSFYLSLDHLLVQLSSLSYQCSFTRCYNVDRNYRSNIWTTKILIEIIVDKNSNKEDINNELACAKDDKKWIVKKIKLNTNPSKDINIQDSHSPVLHQRVNGRMDLSSEL